MKTNLNLFPFKMVSIKGLFNIPGENRLDFTQSDVHCNHLHLLLIESPIFVETLATLSSPFQWYFNFLIRHLDRQISTTIKIFKLILRFNYAFDFHFDTFSLTKATKRQP